jgi:hypothetical protein
VLLRIFIHDSHWLKGQFDHWNEFHSSTLLTALLDAHAIALAQLKEHVPTEWSFSSLEEGETDDADWSKNLPDEIIQNVLKECQLSVCRCFPSDSAPNRFFCKFIGSNRALSGRSG